VRPSTDRSAGGEQVRRNLARLTESRRPQLRPLLSPRIQHALLLLGHWYAFISIHSHSHCPLKLHNHTHTHTSTPLRTTRLPLLARTCVQQKTKRWENRSLRALPLWANRWFSECLGDYIHTRNCWLHCSGSRKGCGKLAGQWQQCNNLHKTTTTSTSHEMVLMACRWVQLGQRAVRSLAEGERGLPAERARALA
jgi:hypothetical protein